MKQNFELSSLDNLHDSLVKLVERKKWNIKSACYISNLDIDAEQLWVLRFYNENSVLPTIKQAKEILKVHGQKRLTLKVFREIMAASLMPQKLVFHYSDIAPFFKKGQSIEAIKQDILKVLSNWKNRQ